MLPGRATDLKGAVHWCFRCVVKNQRHPVASRNRNQPMARFRFTELLCAADKLIQQFDSAALLINQQLGVADNVDKEHIGDLEFHLLLNLCGYVCKFYSVATEGSASFFRRLEVTPL